MSRWRRLALGCLVLLGASGAAGAQEISAGLRAKFSALHAKPAESWTAADFEEFLPLLVAFAREAIDFGLQKEERERLRDVKIVLEAKSGGPPAHLSDGVIHLSTEALDRGLTLGMILGHDIYVNNGAEFSLARPQLLFRPFAVRAILPLLPSLRGAWVDSIPVDLVKCESANTACTGPQEAAIVGGICGFLIAHEMAHLLLGHEVGLVLPTLEEEIAADRKALAILANVARQTAGDLPSVNHDIKVAIEAGPIVLLRWLVEAEKPDPDQLEIYENRLEVLESSLSEAVAVDVSMVVDRETAIGRLRSVQIRWEETPDELYLNGVRLIPAEVAGKTLKIFGALKVFARLGERFAFHELGVVPRDTPEVVQLSYAPLVSRYLPPEAWDRLREQEQWLEILLAGSDPSLSPRPGIPAKYFYEALAKMGVGQLIGSRLPGLEKSSDRFLPSLWRTEAAPIGTWLPLPR